ncbi:TraC family protein, partial [Yersinia enterocolitica]|uniref:TraC family protein n=1 Tax=Yersinia enterocolitica TaxID=630 RepID=UPI001C60CA0B
MKQFLKVLENLQKAFRMPDGAAQMTRNLASLDYPQLTSVLPYRDYDQDSGLFVNQNTVGFLLKAQPLIGANEQIVYVLEDLLKSKLPRKTPIAFHLVSSKLIGEQLDQGLAEFRWQGKHAEKFNRITRAYYQRAAQQQFNSPTGLPLTLRDYRLYISFCVKAKKRTAAVMTEVAHIMKVLRSSLDAAKIYTKPADAQDLATLVHSMINARHDQLSPETVHVGRFDELHQRCIDPRIELDVRPDDVLISLAHYQGAVTRTRAMNFMLEHNPDMFMLWMGGDNI